MDLIIQALVMGVVQGLTEFLPVSSSGHLVIVPWLFGWDDAFITSLAFSVMLHLGTLVALLVYFRADILSLTRATLTDLAARQPLRTPEARLSWMIVAGTVPIVVCGLAFKDFIKGPLRSLK